MKKGGRELVMNETLTDEEVKIDVPAIEEVIETPEPEKEEIKGRITAIGITRKNKEESKHSKKIAKASRKKSKQIKNKKRKFSKRPNKKKG
jgi:hypothetical protein